MSKDDPFASIEGGRTIIMPSPGGRAPASQAAEPMPSRAAMDTAAPILNVGLNPLLAAANPLLNLVPQLRATLRTPIRRGSRTPWPTTSASSRRAPRPPASPPKR
ncbi:MAG: hypothetical protein MZV65_47965 [Chromatiales bacterium]|nr:hypothetical protein [Chromatiales bacterium]